MFMFLYTYIVLDLICGVEELLRLVVVTSMDRWYDCILEYLISCRGNCLNRVLLRQ